jgi:hypothetical protein
MRYSPLVVWSTLATRRNVPMKIRVMTAALSLASLLVLALAGAAPFMHY